jgi:hypothetical protein
MDGATRVSYNDLSYLKKRFALTSELIEIVPGDREDRGNRDWTRPDSLTSSVRNGLREYEEVRSKSLHPCSL